MQRGFVHMPTPPRIRAFVYTIHSAWGGRVELHCNEINAYLNNVMLIRLIEQKSWERFRNPKENFSELLFPMFLRSRRSWPRDPKWLSPLKIFRFFTIFEWNIFYLSRWDGPEERLAIWMLGQERNLSKTSPTPTFCSSFFHTKVQQPLF